MLNGCHKDGIVSKKEKCQSHQGGALRIRVRCLVGLISSQHQEKNESRQMKNCTQAPQNDTFSYIYCRTTGTTETARWKRKEVGSGLIVCVGC